MLKLPKKVNRREAKIDDPVADWFLKNWPNDVGLEVKIKGNTLETHQANALTQIEKGRFKYKIPDTGRRNPLDYIVLVKADAAVCTVDGKKVDCTVNGNFTVSFSL